MEAGKGEITHLLQRWSDGNSEALEQLIPIVYDELKRLAGHYLRLERPGHTLQSTALVHEAYLRLANHGDAQWQDRRHFFAVASQIVRHILVDHARKHRSLKRGEGQRVSLDDALTVPVAENLDIIALDRSLERLTALDPRKARIVEMRFFGGLSVDEIGAALDISAPTVKRHWAVAKLWLSRDMVGGEPL
jgi:RNA polymerase sigma factor (TIGR02999 family)